MKLKIFLALLAFSPLVHAADPALEIIDNATNKVNNEYIAPRAQEFLNKNYPGVSVKNISPLRTFIRRGVVYQSATVTIVKDGTNKGSIMEYVYDTNRQQHTFVDVFEFGQLIETGSDSRIFNGNHQYIGDFPK
jgi:hypothetical protein